MRVRGQLSGVRGQWNRLASRLRTLPQSSFLSPQSSSLVDGEFLRKLDRLSLGLGHELISGLMGEHPAVRKTTGIEFADYRQYSAGDDLRRVDWNAYARLGTLHVRQAQAEHDTLLYLLVDSSPSMEFGQPSKFWAARRLAAALGYIALAHLDSVVLSTPGAGVIGSPPALNPQSATPGGYPNPQSLTTIRGRAEASSLFRSLHDLRVGAAVPFDDLLVRWTTWRNAGKAGRIAVILSDLLLDEYKAGVRQLVGEGFQVTVMHLLGPEELDPPDEGELELIDSETGERLEVHTGDESLAEYRRRLNEWLRETEEWSRSAGATYLLIRSDTDVERVLLDTLRRRGITV